MRERIKKSGSMCQEQRKIKDRRNKNKNKERRADIDLKENGIYRKQKKEEQE